MKKTFIRIVKIEDTGQDKYILKSPHPYQLFFIIFRYDKCLRDIIHKIDDENSWAGDEMRIIMIMIIIRSMMIEITIKTLLQ